MSGCVRSTELALHHSLQAGRVGERIRRLRRRLLEEAVDGDLEVHVVCSRQQKGGQSVRQMVHGRSEVEAEVPQRLSIISYLSALFSVRFRVHMQLRSPAQRAQQSAAQKEQRE